MKAIRHLGGNITNYATSYITNFILIGKCNNIMASHKAVFWPHIYFYQPADLLTIALSTNSVWSPKEDTFVAVKMAKLTEA